MNNREKKIHRGSVSRWYIKFLGNYFSKIMWSGLSMDGHCSFYDMESVRYRERRYPAQVSLSASILNGRCGVPW